MFIGLTVVISLMFWFRYRTRTEVQQTIRRVLDKDVVLTPELLDRLGQPTAGKNADLRVATIWLSLAVALVLCGLAVGDEEVMRGTLAGAAFPFCIGIAYILNWRFASEDF